MSELNSTAWLIEEEPAPTDIIALADKAAHLTADYPESTDRVLKIINLNADVEVRADYLDIVREFMERNRLQDSEGYELQDSPQHTSASYALLGTGGFFLFHSVLGACAGEYQQSVRAGSIGSLMLLASCIFKEAKQN